MESEAYYVLATDDRWSINRNGEDLGVFENREVAVHLATVLAKAACEMGFNASVVAIGAAGDIDREYECDGALLSEQVAGAVLD